MKTLNLGCGKDIRQSTKNITYVNLDKFNLPGVDVVWDLDKYPWPFKDNEFDKVIAKHVIEHLEDVVRAIEEIYRILKPGGILYIEVPIYPNPNAFADPTHKHVFTERTFNFFCPNTPLGRENDYCTKARFKIKSKQTDTWGPNLYLELEAVK